MAIRGCAAHSWQEEQDEPLNSVSGEMVLARVPSWPGWPAEWGSSYSNRTLTAAHFMDHCFPLQLKNCRPLAVFQPLCIRRRTQPAPTEITLHLKSIKSCSMVMLHLCCMTKVQVVKSLRVNWLWMISFESLCSATVHWKPITNGIDNWFAQTCCV